MTSSLPFNFLIYSIISAGTNRISNMKNLSIIFTCMSIVFFPLPAVFAQTVTTAEANVDVFMIQEADGSTLPIVITDASAKTEVKKNTRRRQMDVEAVASVEIHELQNILPKKPGDVENVRSAYFLK